MRAEAEPETSDEVAAVVDEREAYDRHMSPVPIDLSSLSTDDRQLEIIEEVDDRRSLFAQRRSVASSRFVPKPTRPEVEQDVAAPSGADLESEALYRAEAEKEMDEE
jgi:hypothetical protein